MGQSEKNSPNIFVRVLIAIFCLFLAAMIVYNYVFVVPKGNISNGIITLLLLMLTLILSESFDNFSIGKLISITREAKKKEKEVEQLEKRNSELLSQIISISNNNKQTQNSTNVYGDYHAAPTVTKATSEEVEDEGTESVSARDCSSRTQISYNWREAEKIALGKYLESKNIHPSSVIIEAKLTTQFHGIDPVSNIQPIYDAYFRDGSNEVFVEMKPNRGSGIFLRDRLYVMLSKIAHYRNAKNASAYLELVLMNVPDKDETRAGGLGRTLEFFEPAIASGLLRISDVSFTEEELNAFLEKKRDSE